MPSEPTRLISRRLVLRTGTGDDARALHDILSEPSVQRWWGTPATEADIAAELVGAGEEVVLVVEVDGHIAGAIQYGEQNEPDYRHATIDLYLATRFQGQGLGPLAVSLLAAHLVDDRGHHRVTIDPARENQRAIKAYETVGFRRVGVLREYERRGDAWHDGLLLDLLARELVRLG